MYKCPYCEREDFPQLNDQRAHISEAHPGLDINRCAICNKAFSNRGNLVSHLKRHSKDKPFVCAICNAGFIFQSLYTQHMRTHTGERPYRCSMCGACFHRKDILKVHMRIHTGARSHVCNECDREFVRAQDFSRHMHGHTREKTHACGQCDQRFSQVQQLNAHMQSHTGEKPFACTICDIAFSHADSLTAHMETRHPYTYEFNNALADMLSDQQNRFSDFAQAHHYVSDLFDGPTPATVYHPCPHCGENVADLGRHIASCPWRPGPSWQ